MRLVLGVQAVHIKQVADDLIHLLKSNRNNRQHAILKLKEHLLGMGEDIDLYNDDNDYPCDIVNEF